MHVQNYVEEVVDVALVLGGTGGLDGARIHTAS
jgi:hypothetical protein